MNKSILRLSANALTCLLFLFSSHLLAQNCAGNLPTNSGFEQGTAGWQILAGTATTSSDANSGSSALELGGSAGANIINQVFAGKPNTFYSLRAFVKKNNTDNTQPQARIKFYTSAWQPLNAPIERISNSTYEQIVFGRKSPANTAYVGVEFSYNTNPNSQKLLIDDVCFLEEPNNANCSISAQAVNLICDDNGTPVNQLDDTFTFDLLVTGSNNSSGWRTIQSNFFFADGSYDTPTTIESLRISAGPGVYTISDYGNENCQTVITINPPPPCSDQASGCDIDLAITQPVCNNNGTPDNPLDDTYTFQATVTGTNTGSGWTSSTSGTLSGINGNYNQATTIGPVDVYNSQVSFFGVRDRDSNSPCSDSKSMNGPLACSNSNPNVCPGSLLQNGNFSNGLNGWQLSNIAFNGTTRQAIANVVSGGAFGQGVQICNDTQNSLFLSYIFQEFPVTPGPGKEGLVTWNYRRVSGSGNAHVRLYFEDAAGNSLFSQGLNPGFQGDWNTFSFSRVIPDNAVKVIVAYGINQGAPTATGCVIFDELCFQVIGGIPPPPPNCAVNAVVNVTPCYDRGTNDPSDDGYNFTIDATATGGGSGYNVSWIQNGTPKSFNGTYGQQQFIGQNLIANGVLNLTISDNANSACQTTATVTPPAPCSGPQGNGGDLELTATSNTPNVNAWSFATTTFTLTNTGNVTSTGIEVDFIIDDKATLKGGDEFDASQGTLQSFWLRTPTWQVGSLAPGQSATIDLNIFALSGNEIPIYGQVSDVNEVDPDSTPGNGACCSANEDDEAVFTFNGSNPPPPSGTDLRVENVRLRSTPPVIIGQGVSVFFDGIIDGTPLTNSQFPITYSLYLSTDRTLSGNDVKILDLNMGFGPGLQFGGQVPTSMTAGNYYMIVEIDTPNNITETNENNNWTASTATVALQNNNPPANLPDLTFGALFINNAPSAGEVLNYNFNLVNAGTATAAGNYNIKAYISTDNVLSSDDIQDGIVPTGNTPVGTINTVPGASTLPANLPQGDYFLILKVDADNQITESDEGNNIIIQPFTSQPTTGGSSCAFIKYQAIDSPSGGASLIENSNEYQIESIIQTNFSPRTFEKRTITLDLDGNYQSSSTSPYNPSNSNVTLEEDGNTVEMVFGAGTALPAGTRVPIDFGITNITALSVPTEAYQTISGGYAFGLFVVESPSNTLNRIVVKTDNRGQNVQLINLSAELYNGFLPFLEAADGTLFFRVSVSGNFSLHGVPGDGSPAWRFRVASDTPSSTWTDTRVSQDGRFVYTAKTDNMQVFISKLDVRTGQGTGVPAIDLTTIKTPSPSGVHRFTYAQGIAPTPDGGLLVSISFNEVSGTPRLSGNIIAKADATGNIVWSQEFNRPQYHTALFPAGQTSDGGALFYGKDTKGTTAIADDEAIFVKTTNTGALTPLCGGTPPPPPGNGADLELSYSPFSGSSPAQWSFFGTTLTLTNTGNAGASGVEVKLKRPTEAVYKGGDEFNASQGDFQHWGDEIWRVGTLAPGQTATMDVNYFRLSGNGFSLYAQVSGMNESDSDSTPGNGSCCSSNEDDEAGLQFGNAVSGSVNNRSAVAENLGSEIFAIVNASPNPTTGRFNVEVYSNENQTSEITVVDILGKPVFRKAVELNEGHNTIPIDLENQGTGMMILKMTPFHPYLRQIRVMKVRD